MSNVELGIKLAGGQPVFGDGPQHGRRLVELAAEPTGGTRHAQIPDADRDSVRPVPA
jgi:hypothetical protein